MNLSVSNNSYLESVYRHAKLEETPLYVKLLHARISRQYVIGNNLSIYN
jgi:hypothetical protein